LQVLGGVQTDPKDPGAQVLHVGKAFLGAPAAQEGFLGDVLGVLLVAEHEPEGADQFVAQVVEGAQQGFRGGGHRRGILRRSGTHAGGWSAHTVTLQTRESECRIAAAVQKRGRSPP
jgi:hypothetical protein